MIRGMAADRAPSFAARLGLHAVGAALLVAASPGIVSGEGFLSLAVLALAVWGGTASRPGRGAFLVDWAAGSAAMAAVVWWMAYVSPPALLYVGPGMGLYVALSGVLLRRLARRVPLPLAVAAAWILGETLRCVVPPPLGLAWLRLGHHAHEHAWLAGGARVFGVQGMGFCLALAGGALAQLARGNRTSGLAFLAAGLGVPALAAAVTRPPEVVDGPRLLLIQMGVPQERKRLGSPAELLEAGIDMTRRGLAEASAPPDLVCWGETMLPLAIADPDLAEALRAGAERPHWMTGPWGPEVALRLDANEDFVVLGEILGVSPDGERGAGGLLPEGTRFLAGAEQWAPANGRVVRRVAAFLWEPDGSRAPAVGKQHLVPGAETMVGLERFEWVREACRENIGYVPSFEPFDGAGAVALETRDGRHFDVGISICFDNAFVDPYVDAVAEHGVDFHLVLSNEAWYGQSCELDQMIAFSKLAAIATGRSVVRTTNSGVTALIGPGGEELERLLVDGRDREVGGALEVVVPVPAGGSGAHRTPFVRLRPAWLAIWLAGPLLLLLRRSASPNPGRA